MVKDFEGIHMFLSLLINLFAAPKPTTPKTTYITPGEFKEASIWLSLCSFALSALKITECV